MKNFKVLKAAVIMFALLFAVTGVAYADENTSKFTDIDGHWAEQHIINVYSKGLMGGASETQFKPGEFVKNYDALVSISRMVNREKDINLEQLAEKYQTNVIEKFGVPDYARDAVLICLDKGIILDFEVETFSKYPLAFKKDISKYMGKALGLVPEINAPPVVLAFKDTLLIHNSYKPYIKFLIDKGIINGSGDVNNEFNPNDYVDRAAFGKMLDIASSVYDKDVLGVDAAVPDTGSADTTLTDSDNSSEITWPDTNASEPPAVVEDEEPADVTAYVDQVIPEYGNLKVFVGTESRVYKVSPNATCTIDDVAMGYWKLEKSDMVRLYINNGEVVKIVGESKVRKVVGKLVSIQAADKTVLTIQTTSGETRKYTVTAKTIVIKDGKNALWQELKNGNDLLLTTSYDELIEVNADGVKSSDKGVIESIVHSRMAPAKLVITTLEGKQNTYYANKSMTISGAANDVYSLKPGMQVEVSLIDDEISKIAVVNEAAAVQAELKGIVKSIDTGARLIVAEVYDVNINKYIDKKIYLTEDTKIAYVDLSTLEINTLALDSLKAGQNISVVGTGSTDGIFAKTIQLLN
ncbi:MAG TPA: S-layer homology domain-containing protein [Clostridia bacterium]|nr:S-layer homology domain-containing protein [Clostridia bacterium]